MKNNIVLVFILLTSFVLRFYKLGYLPNSYSPDEIAQGYTAYSILNTGKDEWGRTLPLSLRSFGDFKPPLQTYLLVPLVKFFGLNTFTVRLPSAFLGSLLPLFVFLFTIEILKNKSTALLASFATALSSWAIGASRIGLEANLAAVIFMFGTYLIYKGKKLTNLGIVLYIMTLFTYHSSKLVVPLILFYFFLSNRINLRQHMYSLAFVFFSLFYIFFLQGNEARIRSNDLALYNPTDNWKSVSDNQYLLSTNKAPTIISRLLFNKLTYTFDQFIRNYAQYISPQFIITTGVAETTYGMIPGFGMLNPILVLGLVISIISFIKKQDRSLLDLIIIYLICLVPASLAKGDYSGNRVLLGLPFLIILASWGLTNFKLNKTIFALVFLFSFKFIFYYFFAGNAVFANGMLFGHKEANLVISTYPKTTKIIYSRKLSEPQSYFMFFQQLDPSLVQKYSPAWLRYANEGRSFLDQLGEYQLDNATFKELNKDDFKINDVLIVGRPEDFFDIKPTKVIYYPGFEEKPAIYVYKN